MVRKMVLGRRIDRLGERREQAAGDLEESHNAKLSRRRPFEGAGGAGSWDTESWYGAACLNSIFVDLVLNC